MNDLGLTLAWLAVQVAFLLVPSLVLHAVATRRGPASGAWVATLSLGLVVVLGFSAFVPEIERKEDLSTSAPTVSRPASVTPTGESPVRNEQVAKPEPSSPPASQSRTFEDLRLAWTRLRHQVAEPTARIRPWGRALAVVALVGSGVGLLRLLLGLWAVGVCRHRGRRVDDRSMIALVEELRGSMGYRPSVDLLEVSDLTTPATAGWLRPMLLLPDDWRSWDESERRAVVAHELAHMIQGDYAAGLVARVAVALHFYHPLVRWMASRLHLQQELAADSLGARFAGGRSSYLVALSRLALKQDGRSPGWPARAFLPARGTLIRRITMLRLETESNTSGNSCTRTRRLATAICLLALSIGVATLRGPALASDDTPAPSTEESKAKSPAVVATPFEPIYVPERMAGIVAFRPAATFRRTGMALVLPMFRKMLADALVEFAALSKLDTSKPGRLKLEPEDVESVICGISFDQSKGIIQDPEKQQEKLHTIEFGGLTVRTVAPFDWLVFLREWGLEFDEIRVSSRVYYKVKGAMQPLMGQSGCVYLPDNRTIVFEQEKSIREFIARDVPVKPDYLRGSDWERVSRSLLAVAINNKDGALAKSYDLGRPDDAVVLSIFKEVDRWVFGIDDADAISFHAKATCASADASRSIAQGIDSLLKLAREEVESPVTEAMTAAVPSLERMLQIGKSFFAKIRVEPLDNSLRLKVEDFATFADVASILLSVINPEDQKAEAEPNATKH